MGFLTAEKRSYCHAVPHVPKMSYWSLELNARLHQADCLDGQFINHSAHVLSGGASAALFSAPQLYAFGEKCTATEMCLSRRQKLARSNPFVTCVLWVPLETV